MSVSGAVHRVPRDLLEPVCAVAEAAGRRIMEIYGQDDLGVEYKADNSPLTAADLSAHREILSGLQSLTPEIPILSEESAAEVSEAERLGWRRYWLVDPLDGTKEFVRRNGEFTVNIALVDQHVPILGVVHVPVQKVTYLGVHGDGAWRVDGEGRRERISVSSVQRPLRVVGSRSHAGPHLQAYADALGVHSLVPRGSSLKLCLVAEGQADVYPRFGPTSEWDTAAAQAVVTSAGGRVVDLDGEDLGCNRHKSILNPYFIVYGDASLDWLAPLPADLLSEQGARR